MPINLSLYLSLSTTGDHLNLSDENQLLLHLSEFDLSTVNQLLAALKSGDDSQDLHLSSYIVGEVAPKLDEINFPITSRKYGGSQWYAICMHKQCLKEFFIHAHWFSFQVAQFMYMSLIDGVINSGFQTITLQNHTIMEIRLHTISNNFILFLF